MQQLKCTMNPQQNGRYQLNSLIGEGGMGKVYHATDRLSGQTVALKKVTSLKQLHITKSYSEEQSLEALCLALAHEFKILAGLRHPHIISVLDYGFDSNQQPFFTMDFLSHGLILTEAAVDVTPETKLDLIQQTLQALAYLHRHHIFHRDLKPENVMVQNGKVRVLDFGLAASGHEVSSSAGTYLYMAPEQWTDQHYSVAADLYAVGVLAYELFAGRHPFGELDHDFILRVLEDAPDLTLLDAPVGITAVIDRLLAKNPADRFESANATITALAVAAGIEAPPETKAIRESYLQAARFVGRHREKAELLTALHKAKSGAGSAWLLGGESGVGKSRLIGEIQTQALVNGFIVLQGRGVQDGSSLPFHIWREPLRHLLVMGDEIADLTAGVLMPLVPDISRLIGRPVQPAPELDEAEAQTRLFVTISQLFWENKRPLLLILEDLHWTHESLLPIPFLTRLVTEAPILIIGTYRNDERPNLPEKLSDIQTLALNRLTDAEMAELSEAMLGPIGKQADIQSLIQRETEGNTFFAVEIVRALAEEAGRLGNIGKIELPKTLLPNGIRDIVQRRLDKISESSYPLLTLMATAGREIELPLIRTLSPHIDIDNEFLPICAEAAIVELQNGEWQFSHNKIRDGILEMLSAKNKRMNHLQVAEAIVQLHAEAPEHASRLAFHWEAGGEIEKAATSSMIAGNYAASQFANEDAITLLSKAFVLTPAEAIERQYEIVSARQVIHEYTGNREAEANDLRLLESLVQQLGQPEKQIDLLLKKALNQSYQAQLEDSLQVVVEAVDQAEALTLPDLAARGRMIGANILESLSNYPNAIQWAKASLAFFTQASGNEKEMGRALQSLAKMAWRQERFDEALHYAEQAIGLARLTEDLLGEARVHDLNGLIFDSLKRHDESKESYESGLAIARDIGAKKLEALLLNHLIGRAIDITHYEETYPYFEQHLSLVQDVGDRVGVLMNLGNSSLVNLLVGHLETARKQSEICVAEFRKVGQKHSLGIVLYNLGSVYAGLGEIELARGANEESLAIKRELNQRLDIAFVLNNMGSLALDQDEMDTAVSCYTEALSIAVDIGAEDYAAQSNAGLALTFYKRGQQTAVSQYLEPAYAYSIANPLVGYWEPFRTCLMVFKVLHASNDNRARKILAYAYKSLQEQARRMQKEENRHAFLNNLLVNKEIVHWFELISELE